MARGLEWRPVQLTLGVGLDSKDDARASTGSMDIARDVWYDEPLGVQVRRPMVAMPNTIIGGGTLANCRRLDTVENELLVTTKDSLYSWNAQQQGWALRGTNLACQVTETPVVNTTGDQIDGDQAELNGTIVRVWSEGTVSFVAAFDKATGSTLVTPTSISGAASARPRVVALATKLLLFYIDTGASTLAVKAIDPASPATGIAGGGTGVSVTANLYYDVVRIDTQDSAVGACRLTPTTSYRVWTVTAGLSITTATKARTADGPLAVASLPGGGVSTQVIRGNGTNIQGDFLTTSTLADVTINQAVGTAAGTPVNQIAACYRSVQTGGTFRCYAFWSAQETSGFFSSGWFTKFNFVASSGAIGTEAPFLSFVGPGSRAFDYNGQVYLWMTFGSDSTTQMDVALNNVKQAQNAYLLYRDDQFLVAKAVYNSGGGLRSSTGLLPGVALTLGSTIYSWTATERRRIDLGAGTTGSASTGFAARSPRDVTFTFDSGSGRRAAELGKSLYIASGEILEYDGVRIVESGFHFYPWSFDMLKSGAGNVATGTYGYKLTYRWQNARGEVERSTTATIGTATMTAGPARFVMGSIITYNLTHKTMTAGAIAIEVWRTAVNSDASTPFYLASSVDPNATTAPNQYLFNEQTNTFRTWTDEAADATLGVRETNPENGAVLSVLCPPGASIIIATDTRLFLAGVNGQPDSVWYSLLREDGEIAGFNDALVIPIPPPGGDITALAFLGQMLVVFRETSIYGLEGQGFDNGGGGSNYGPANWLAQDVGAVSMESVVSTPMGIVFKSRKGWYLLDRGAGIKYIGRAVSSFDGDTVLAAHVVETQHHVRILTNARLIMWDYWNVSEEQPIGQWSEATISDGVHATIWNGSYVYLTTTGPKIEQATYASGVNYGFDLETTWIKTADLQGGVRVRLFEILGELRSTGWLMRLRVARDYQYDVSGNPVYYDDVAWAPTPTVVGSALQVRHSPSSGNGQCEAIKVRMTAVTDAVRATLATTALSPQVATSGTVWTATWTAALPGVMGNAITMSVGFDDGTPFAIDVRDHFAWDRCLQRWREDVNNIGVRVVCRTGSSPTVAQLETAIVAATTLATLTSADPTPSKIINAATMPGSVFPSTAVAMNAAVGGGTWTAGYLCEDASAAMSASFGGTNLAQNPGGGSPAYQVAGPLGDKAVEIFVQSTGFFAPNGTFLDVAAGDLCVAMVARTGRPLIDTTYPLSKSNFVGGTGYSILIQTNGAVNFNAGPSPGFIVTETPADAMLNNDWVVIMAVMDRSVGKARVAVRSISGGGVALSPMGSTIGFGSISNSDPTRVSITGGVGAKLDISALYIGANGGTTAAGMADNIEARITSFAAYLGRGSVGSFAGGAYGSPTGECAKLTGIGLEVGVKPGLYRRLPPGQKT
jgi:hypothetical protein